MTDIIDFSDLPSGTMIITENMGFCKVCGKYDDLRCRVCFHCADFVKSDGKWAWDIRKPNKKWNVQAN